MFNAFFRPPASAGLKGPRPARTKLRSGRGWQNGSPKTGGKQRPFPQARHHAQRDEAQADSHVGSDFRPRLFRHRYSQPVHTLAKDLAGLVPLPGCDGGELKKQATITRGCRFFMAAFAWRALSLFPSMRFWRGRKRTHAAFALGMSGKAHGRLLSREPGSRQSAIGEAV